MSDAPESASPQPPAPRREGTMLAARVGRWLGWITLGLLLTATPLVVRVAWEGRAELSQADLAQGRDDTDAEIEHLGRAARWRLPGASHDEEALQRLEAIGQAAQAVGAPERHTALAAYREIRRALLATRSFGVPHPERFERANAEIAALMVEQAREFGTDLTPSDRTETDPSAGDPATAQQLALLQQVPGPDPWRANFAALAFVAWLVASAGFVLRGLDGQGRLRARPALRWGGSSVAMLVAWAVLLGTAR